MKKHLLSILALVACFFVGAAQESVTFDFVNETYGLTRGSANEDPYIDNGATVSQDPVTITLSKNEGTNGMRLWNDGLRFYKNSGAGFTVSVPAGYAVTSVRIMPVTGSWALADGCEGTFDSSNKSWSGEASSVTINFTAAATKPVTKLVVEYKTVETPEPGLTEGDGTKEHPYSIAEAVAAGVSGTLESNVWICGYIVGYTTGAFFAPGPQFTADGAPEYRILLSDNPEETAIKGCLDVLNFNMTDYTGDEKKEIGRAHV